ncbi:hypothetical protein ADK43_17510 [Streptomyces rimosus subsp. rimosus]|nr:hypothetical protein ADK43_17510 [Streptomyces rimosus subsp. rimosus]
MLATMPKQYAEPSRGRPGAGHRGRAGRVPKRAGDEGRDQAMRVAGLSPEPVVFVLDQGDYARSPIR